MITITASEFNRSVDKYLALADKEEVIIVRGRWNSKYYRVIPISETESQTTEQTDFKIGDKVIVTINVQNNDTGKEFEATIIDIENNPFKGLVLSVETADKQIYFTLRRTSKK